MIVMIFAFIGVLMGAEAIVVTDIAKSKFIEDKQLCYREKPNTDRTQTCYKVIKKRNAN